ncbi:NAD(P)/FAD-dependent oxidoreductase [Devosia marina]|uniref:FAD-dependent oxidoreductase n=1 Tax=Devosia marina TaxID=2683198 RepID=A0A7X3FPH2_9HYPH|nr:NAD(P)/FAD-dependent oxidoreductase [Devosia marina]MVS97922.1 FAD-dependent oxidoreductase [Devosia marina]
MANLAIVGAGAMGLAAAFHALKAGHQVTVYEGDKVAGGMAAHFDFGGVSIERFYHFVCKPDQPLFSLMGELGIGDKMVWRETSMGYFIDGKTYGWGDPISLLTFPKMGLIDKFRYGLTAFWQTKRPNFDSLEHVSGKDWFLNSMGRRTYELLWKPLLDLKFFEYADNVSAAWLATRVKRIGNSRKSLLQEELGYIEGGSQTLVDALVSKIEALGGTILLGDPVREIVSENGRVTGIAARDRGFTAHDHVISTAPTPYIPEMVPALPEDWKQKYRAIHNIGVVCVLLKIKKPVTKNFWLNINDARFEIPGIVEFSNLRHLPETVVYVPYYMPQTHEKFDKPAEFFEAETRSYIKMINPEITDADIVDVKVGRLRHAQPICEPGFAAKIPPVQTPIAGLQIADTCYYYPEDRGISESVRFAKEMVSVLPAHAVSRSAA